MKNKTKIISIGDIAIDLLIGIPNFPVLPDDFILTDYIEFEPGGSANFVIAAKRLGADICPVGVLGNDTWGNQVRKIFEQEEIEMDYIEQQGTTTQVIVLNSRDKEHAFVGNYGQGAEIQFTETHKDLLDQAAALFLTGYSLNEKRLQKLCLDMLEYAQKSNIPVYFDPGPSFLSLPEELQKQVVQSTTTLLLTEEEIPFVEIDQVESLLDYGPDLVIVKMGENGCRVIQKDSLFHSSGFNIQVLDTTAAGDSFDAGFMTMRINNKPLEESARFANAVGAAKVKKRGGGRNVPNLEEVEQILNNQTDNSSPTH